MNPLPTLALPNSQVVRREAITVLIDQLGIAKATMFLGETFWQPTDYSKSSNNCLLVKQWIAHIPKFWHGGHLHPRPKPGERLFLKGATFSGADPRQNEGCLC